MTTDEAIKLADMIRAHAYTWGPSKLFADPDTGLIVQPYRGGPFDPFPGENALEAEILTNEADVLGIESDGSMLLVFVPDGRYTKLSWDRLPLSTTAEGDIRIYDVKNPRDMQKPYESHGYN